MWLSLSHRTLGGEALLQLGVSSGVNGYVAVIRALGTLPNCHLKQIAKAQNFADFGTQRRMATEEAGRMNCDRRLNDNGFVVYYLTCPIHYPLPPSLSACLKLLMF